MPSTTAQGLRATAVKSGGVSVRPMQNMMIPSRYGTAGPNGLKAPGSRNPATPAASTRRGKTVTATRAILASAARAGFRGAASASVAEGADTGFLLPQAFNNAGTGAAAAAQFMN